MSLHTLDLLAGDEHQMAEIEPLIDAQQAAQILRLHPVTVREMAARRELPGLKIGKVWRFRVSSLDAWINSQLQWERHPHLEKER